MNLSDKQTEAIESWNRGDVSVVAGPGSGKTTVLVEHFRWIVEKRGVRPQNIVAITFTEKAANNMHERLVREAPTAELRKQFERAQISTIDAFCNRLLREHALEVGLDPDFRILDPSEQEVETRRVVNEVLNEVHETDPEATFEFLGAFAGSNNYSDEFQISAVHDQLYQLYLAVRAWDGRPFVQEDELADAYQTLVAAVSALAAERDSQPITGLLRTSPKAAPDLGVEHWEWLTNVEQTIGHLTARGPGKDLIKNIRDNLVPRVHGARLSARYSRSRKWIVRVTERIGEAYGEWKRVNAALDFPDLVELTVRFLDSQPELRSQFHHILIDEYQDTNTPQAKLAKLLRGDSRDGSRVLYAVGDINQSIYGFRHADPDVFRDYLHEVESGGGHVVELMKNFRSRPEILKAVDTILRGAEGIKEHKLSAGKDFAPKSIPSVEVLIARGEPEEDREAPEKREMLHTVARIFELHEKLRVGNPARPVRWSDFAILLRTHDLVSRYAATLREAGAPYQLSAGRGFFQASEVRDLVNFLRILRNPRDEIGLVAVLRSPLAGLSDEALLRMKLKEKNLADAMQKPPPLDADDAVKIERFRSGFAYCRRVREDQPADLLLSRLLSETGYEAWLLGRPGGLQQAANVQKLLSILRGLGRARPLTFAELVERLEKLQEVGTPETEASVQDSAEDAIHLMTMHAAKGLEFSVVFLPAIGYGARPDSDPMLYSPDEGIGVSWLDASMGDAFGDAAYLAIREKRKQQERRESNRLFYVAMTRAEEHLVLSASVAAKVQVKGWAKHLSGNLKIDFKGTDEQPRIQQVNGWQFRLYRTSQDPANLRPVLEHPQVSSASWVERAAPGDSSDSEAAVTSIALFADCPRRYYLSRYLGFADERHPARSRAPESSAPDDALPAEPDEVDPTELGRRVHAVLAGSLGPDGVSGEALRMVENFQQSDLGRRVRAAKTVMREQHLTFGIDGRLLRGQIDLWFDGGGQRVLVDYKTDQVSPEEAPQRLRSYALQLQLYSLALRQAGGRGPDRAVAYFLRPNVALEVDLGPQALDRVREAVRQFFTAQSKFEFPLHVSEHCLRCPYHGGICPARYSSKIAGAEGEPRVEIPDAPPTSPRTPQQRTKMRRESGDGQLSLPFHDESQ